ncbi:MAG: 3-keto-5-aminohexanoate cleavage protein [Proteobacteria bacterium]|nr:3-keto-5-aminohexanoate cleavage protein [Pseudomonadota bacterium]
MTTPAIITVAITGAVPRKADNPAVPVTPAEQIESTHEAFEAGASLVHLHVREADESSSSDPALFAEVQAGIAKHCPGIIIQFSTGGRGRDQSLRGKPLYLKPDMASLATGSVNFPNGIYENHPELIAALATEMQTRGIKPEIEIFDLSMLYSAKKLVDQGLLEEPVHVQFVMGIVNAMPVRREILEFLIGELHAVLPGATWTAAGVARHQLTVNRWAAELGGNLRTGLEDNIRFDKTRLANSNAELVALAAEQCAAFGRHPATPMEARSLLSLSPA